MKRLGLVVVLVACGDNASVTAVPVVSGAATLTLSSDQTAVAYNQGALFEVIAYARPTGVHVGATALVEAASFDALEAATTGCWEAATGGTLWIKVGGDQLATIDP